MTVQRWTMRWFLQRGGVLRWSHRIGRWKGRPMPSFRVSWCVWRVTIHNVRHHSYCKMLPTCPVPPFDQRLRHIIPQPHVPYKLPHTHMHSPWLAWHAVPNRSPKRTWRNQMSLPQSMPPDAFPSSKWANNKNAALHLPPITLL
jgi:hypothetical protein